jgi:hypothetical protein
MRYRYEIDNANAVRVWDDENPTETGAAFFYQPNHPEARPWADFAEAQAWVDAFIVMLLTPAPVESE